MTLNLTFTLGPNAIILDGTKVPSNSIIGEGVHLALERNEEEDYPLILSDIRRRQVKDQDTYEDDDFSESDDEYDEEDEFAELEIRPIEPPEFVLKANETDINHWGRV